MLALGTVAFESVDRMDLADSARLSSAFACMLCRVASGILFCVDLAASSCSRSTACCKLHVKAPRETRKDTCPRPRKSCRNRTRNSSCRILNRRVFAACRRSEFTCFSISETMSKMRREIRSLQTQAVSRRHAGGHGISKCPRLPRSGSAVGGLCRKDLTDAALLDDRVMRTRQARCRQKGPEYRAAGTSCRLAGIRSRPRDTADV